MSSLLLGGTKDSGNRASQPIPLGCFDRQLLSPLFGQSVELRAAIVLGGSRVEGDPPAFDQSMQRRVQRSLLHEQHVVGAVFDRFGNRMSMGRTKPQRPKNQEIERTLEKFNAIASLG